VLTGPIGANVSLIQSALRPVDASPLAVFRFVLGVTFWFWATSFLTEDRWSILFVQPTMLFKYGGFEWVQLWPSDGIWWHFQLARIAAVCFAIGLLTRLSALVLAGSMAYVILVERQLYNNHDYLLACTAFLCVFLPCNRRFAIDRLIWRRENLRSMPAGYWWLLRFQLALPYVFGGIAKLDFDWLAGQPSGLFLSSRTGVPLLGGLFQQPAAPMVMAWGGLLFDLLIVPSLVWKPTRIPAVLAALAFHLTNATIFRIGVFPWFMLATLFVFFPVSVVPRLIAALRRSIGRFQSADAAEGSANLRRETDDLPSSLVSADRKARWIFAAAALYAIVQLLLPIRPWVLPGNPSWNERGHRFAWRMMLRHKDCLLWFKVQSGTDYLFVPANFVLSPNQLRRVPRDPELVRQAARKIAELAKTLGKKDCQVFAWNLVSLNGRPARALIDPEADLTQARRGWFRDDWVLQDPGPFADPVWGAMADDWWQESEVPASFSGLAEMRPGNAQRMFDLLREQELIKESINR